MSEKDVPEGAVCIATAGIRKWPPRWLSMIRERYRRTPNFCRVTATPEEVILDFGLNPQPFATGRQDVKANQRIVMNFYTAKRLLTAARDDDPAPTSRTFGAIELDVRRRAGSAQQQFAQGQGRPAGPGPQGVVE